MNCWNTGFDPQWWLQPSVRLLICAAKILSIRVLFYPIFYCLCHAEYNQNAFLKTSRFICSSYQLAYSFVDLDTLHPCRYFVVQLKGGEKPLKFPQKKPHKLLNQVQWYFSLLECIYLKALSESIASVQGGCVGKDGYDEVLASTYSGKLHIIYSNKIWIWWCGKNKVSCVISAAPISKFWPDGNWDNVLLERSLWF